MIKKIAKILLYLLIFLLVIPYFIPTDYTTQVPDKPYENSVFFTTKSGLRLHTQVYPAVGEEKGKILLIHGLMASTFSFRANSGFLSEHGYTVIAVDLPGFGYSDKPTDLKYTQSNFAAFLWELLDEYDQQHASESDWHLVGHSMGASTSLAMALQKPSRLIDLTMIDGAVTQKNSNIGWLMGTPVGAWVKVIFRYALFNQDNFRKLLQDVYQKEVPQEAVKGYLTPVLIKGTLNGLTQFVKTSKNVMIQDVKGLNLKINVMWGQKDTWIPIAALDEIKATVTVSNTHIFPNAGHTPHETEADFNEALLNMLELQ